MDSIAFPIVCCSPPSLAVSPACNPARRYFCNPQTPFALGEPPFLSGAKIPCPFPSTLPGIGSSTNDTLLLEFQVEEKKMPQDIEKVTRCANQCCSSCTVLSLNFPEQRGALIPAAAAAASTAAVAGVAVMVVMGGNVLIGRERNVVALLRRQKGVVGTGSGDRRAAWARKGVGKLATRGTLGDSRVTLLAVVGDLKASGK